MKYIRIYHVNLKGGPSFYSQNTFSFNMALYAHLVHFLPLYNATLLVVFNIQIFTKHNQSSIFIIVFVQNESNNFMYAYDGALLILLLPLTMTLIHCGLRLRTCSLYTYAMIKSTH